MGPNTEYACKNFNDILPDVLKIIKNQLHTYRIESERDEIFDSGIKRISGKSAFFQFLPKLEGDTPEVLFLLTLCQSLGEIDK